MTNREKIIIGIIIIILIALTIFGRVNNYLKQKNNEKNEFNSILQYFNEENNNVNSTENNILEDNSISEENQINNEIENSNVVIGKEEQESNIENIEIDNKQKAIELAKEEWAISVDSYNFQAELQSDGIYKVIVSNKTTTAYITSYIVNIYTKIVTEE